MPDKPTTYEEVLKWLEKGLENQKFQVQYQGQGDEAVVTDGYTYCVVNELDEEEIATMPDPTRYVRAAIRANAIAHAMNNLIRRQ